MKHSGGDSKNYDFFLKLQMFSIPIMNSVSCGSASKLLLHIHKSSLQPSGGCSQSADNSNDLSIETTNIGRAGLEIITVMFTAPFRQDEEHLQPSDKNTSFCLSVSERRVAIQNGGGRRIGQKHTVGRGS